MLSQDCLHAQARGRLPHRSHRTRRVSLRVQHDYGATRVTLKHRETETFLPQSKTRKDNSRATSSRLRNLPECIKELTENLEDTEVPALANTAHNSDSERLTKVTTRNAQYSDSLPERPKLRGLEANHDYNVSLQEAHWRSSTPGRKTRWLDNSISQSFQWGRWISKQSQIYCRCARFRNSINSILSVWNGNFTGNRREFTKVSRAVWKVESHVEFGKSCEDSSWNHWISTLFRSETNGTAERAVRRIIKKRTSAVLLQSDLDEKWLADSMECNCYLRNGQVLLTNGEKQNFMRFDSENHLKDQSIRSRQRLKIILFLRRTSQGSINWMRKFYHEIFHG